MKFTGSTTLHAPREKVWEALNDPAVLARAIPGCESLEAIGPDAYRVRVTAGVASIKGTYEGEAAMIDPDPPRSCTIKGSGGGAPGTVSGQCRVTLEEKDGVTVINYDADGVVGGVIGGVGQRVLTGVAKKMTAQFFGVVDDVLTGKAPTVPAPRPEAASPGDLVAGAPSGAPTVYPGSAGASLSNGMAGIDFVKGAVFGAVVALTGVVVGGALARSRRG